MAAKYAHQYVWVASFGTVTGFELDRINWYIDNYNRQGLFRYGVSFWEYLSDLMDEHYYGFSALWNDGNPLMSKLHIIKGVA